MDDEKAREPLCYRESPSWPGMCISIELSFIKRRIFPMHAIRAQNLWRQSTINFSKMATVKERCSFCSIINKDMEFHRQKKLNYIVPQHARRFYYTYNGLTPIEFNFFCIVLLMYEVLKMIEVRYTVNYYLYFIVLFIIWF